MMTVLMMARNIFVMIMQKEIKELKLFIRKIRELVRQEI